MASDAQKKHLEKARAERNKHQALLTEIDDLNAKLEDIKKVWHDQGFSFTRYANQLQTLKNTWPELHAKLTELFGEAAPRP